MEEKEKCQYFSVRNGLYYVKRTYPDKFYLLDDISYEWEYEPSLSSEYYDSLSGYVEITEEAMNEYIEENKKLAR